MSSSSEEANNDKAINSNKKFTITDKCLINQVTRKNDIKSKHDPTNVSNLTSVADGVVERFNDIIKRQTPRIGTLFCPNQSKVVSRKDDTKQNVALELGSDDDKVVSDTIYDHVGSGLDKYNRYMKIHAVGNISGFQNLEIRSIVGQEDTCVSNFATGAIRKDRKLASRPPVVGQASSSDSGPFVMNPISQGSGGSSSDEAQVNSSNMDDQEVRRTKFKLKQNSRGLSNREDFISERPPEGSCDQDSPISQPDLQIDVVRVPSPSSVSSAASASFRPLEWDSGADVGYYQLYPASSQDVDSKLSTIERIALARGSAALLTRSDPEGTTEQNLHIRSNTQRVQSKTKTYLKDPIGVPIAESTPFSTNVLITSDNNCEELSELTDQQNTSKNINNKSKKQLYNKVDVRRLKKLNGSFALFPELYDRTNDIYSSNVGETLEMSSNRKITSMDEKSHGTCENLEELELKLVKHKKVSSADTKCNDDPISEEPNEKLSLKNVRRLSCSMENLFEKCNLKEKCITLPRSNSHNNIFNEVHPNNVNSLPKNLLTKSLNPTKSASSSSVSTVVHKKRDSIKRISKLVQTSIGKHSVGTQAFGSEFPFSVSAIDLNAACTSSSSNDMANERSSYFNCPVRAVFDSKGVNSNEQDENQSVIKDSQISNVQCYGAHRKYSKNKCNHDTMDSAETQQQELENNIAQEAGNANKSVLQSNNTLQNIIKSWNTLESVDSSARSQNMWVERRDSIGAEDRVNSFEYLPGHMYENAAMQGNDYHDTGTSSVSLNQIESSRNNYSDEPDNLWDGSASSTLLRDIERGVNLMSDFVKNTAANDNNLKKKLLRKVVEKLLNSNYSEDRLWADNHIQGDDNRIYDACNNGRETRRSHNKELQLSSGKSSSKITSSCCRPQNSVREDNIHKVTADKCTITDEVNDSKSRGETKRASVQSMSSDVITDSGTTYSKPKSTDESVSSQFVNSNKLGSKMRKQVSSDNIKETTNSSSNTVASSVTDRALSVDWKIPVTVSEKMYEMKKRRQENGSKHINCKDSELLLQYMKIERDNQLFWIKNEIDHLSNLKRLLEKQAELKKSLTKMRRLKPRSVHTASSNNGNPSSLKVHSPSKRSHVGRPVLKSDTTSQFSTDWSSHHYSLERNVPNNKAFSKEKMLQQLDAKESSIIRKKSSDYKSDSEVHCTNEAYTSTCGDLSGGSDEGICPHMRRTVGTETTDTVGVQTSKSVHQLSPIKPTWFKNQKKSLKKGVKCTCKTTIVCNYCKNNKNRIKSNTKPVSYFISFDDPDKEKLKEKEVIVLKAPKKNKQRLNSDKGYFEKRHESDSDDSGKTNMSDQKENCEPSKETVERVQSLQDYLLKNRADYVDKAEHRRRCVAELGYLRELRDKSKRQLMAMAPFGSDCSQFSTPRDLPPPPLAIKRVFSQKTMRRQTERKYRQLAEVKSRKLDIKRKESYRTNRLMAEVFTKKLQQKTLKGETNLSNSISVISSL